MNVCWEYELTEQEGSQRGCIKPILLADLLSYTAPTNLAHLILSGGRRRGPCSMELTVSVLGGSKLECTAWELEGQCEGPTDVKLHMKLWG